MHILQDFTLVESLPVHYGKFLAQLRQERGLTQVQLAERARLSVDAVRLAEYAEHKRMFPRTFLSLLGSLHAARPLSNTELAHFGQWSGIAMEVLLSAIENATPAASRIVEYSDLPPLNASLNNAITACLLKVSQSQLADILYEVAQSITRAQIDNPLPPGTTKPTTVTGPGLLGLQHPADNGYSVRIYFEPRQPHSTDQPAPQPASPPVVTPEVKRRKAR
jgi:transcriptional regulator with XRE-family HTH domain